MKESARGSLLFPCTTGASSRLFCFHHAGGGASLYRAWVPLLAPAVEVVRVQLPGRESRFSEPALTSFREAVESLAFEISPWTERPYALFGHSLGALLAFEVARRLAETRRPYALVVSAHAPPGTRAAVQGGRPTSTLSDEQLVGRLERYAGTPREILGSPEIRSVFIPVMRRDLVLAESYSAEPAGIVECPLLAMGGTEDHEAGPACLGGWQRVTTGPVTVKCFDGGHFYFRGREKDVCGAVEAFLSSALPDHRDVARGQGGKSRFP